MKENSPTENLKSPRKKLLAVLKAAIFGAIIFDAMLLISMWIDNSIDNTATHGVLMHFLSGLFYIPAFFLIIPVTFVMNVLGLQDSSHLFIEYIVNSLDGAIISAVPFAIWQFVVKSHKKN